MEQENPFPETSLQQDPTPQQPFQTLLNQNPSHIAATDMIIESSGTEGPFDTNLSQLLKACQFKKALGLVEAEFSSRNADLGENAIELVPLLNQMAEIQIALAQHSKAQYLCRRSEQILQDHQENTDYNSLMAQTHQIMALVLRENQYYSEALGLINKSLVLCSAESRQNIESSRIKALILCDLLQYKEARQEILETVDRSIDTGDQILAARVNKTLGDIHSILHDWKNASKFYEIAMEICRKHDLISHVEMAKAYEGFGRCLIETKRISPAVLEMAEAALKIYEICFGEDPHPARIPCFLLLMRYFKIQKEPSNVKNYTVLAIKEGETFYDIDCEKMREVRLSAAKVCGNRQFKELLVRPILEAVKVGKNSRELLNFYLQKYDACLMCGQYQIFAFMFPEGEKAIKEIYGEKSLEILKIYERIVVYYQATKQLKKMIEYLGKCLEICKEILGENHIEMAKAYLSFSGIYSTKKDYSRATYNVEQALKIQTEFYGEAHPIVIETFVLLANAYGFAGDQAKSLKTHLRILKIQEKTGDEKIYETYESIGMLYSKFNSLRFFFNF